jgi:hypothetical protein
MMSDARRGVNQAATGRGKTGGGRAYEPPAVVIRIVIQWDRWMRPGIITW